MEKLDLGYKRKCLGCGSLFFDLWKFPITCPKCSTVVERCSSKSGRKNKGSLLRKSTFEDSELMEENLNDPLKDDTENDEPECLDEDEHI